MRALPLKAAYTLGELARAASLERRKLRRLLDEAGVVFVRTRRRALVPLSELELKCRPLWEGIKAAEMLRQDSEED
jgi:hypothetical protein